MITTIKSVLLALALSVIGCSNPWDKAAFPIEAYKSGFILEDKILIRRGDVYTFFLAFNCTGCSGDAKKYIEFRNLIGIGRASKNSASIPVRLKIFKGRDVYLEGEFNVDYFDSMIYTPAPEEIKVTTGMISSVDLASGEYQFELEILEGDSRLEKYRSFFLMQYYNPKI